MRAAVRDIYQMSDLREGRDFLASPPIWLGHMSGDFDFIQTNERTPILRNVWAFDMAGIDTVERDIRAWNYGITRLRDDGATLIQGSARTVIPGDAIITAVVDEPTATHGLGR